MFGRKPPLRSWLLGRSDYAAAAKRLREGALGIDSHLKRIAGASANMRQNELERLVTLREVDPPGGPTSCCNGSDDVRRKPTKPSITREAAKSAQS
jgi:hypothetical protein